MEKEKNYPQRKHIRLREYDYSTPGNYFVTIVTRNREDMFGYVIDGQMMLNDAGMMVRDVLVRMSSYYKNVMFTDMVIMPNHLHCIICMTSDGTIGLPKIIRYLKSVTTLGYIHGVKEKGWKRFDRNLWQFKYYDHVIRNQQSYDTIREYISQNPARWNKDKLNPVCEADADDINSVIKMRECGQIQEFVPTR